MEIVKTIAQVRELVKAARERGQEIGLVPTMGALHIGHISLIEKARSLTGFVVVSIFVNPTQFGPCEDFEKYPRPLDDDLEICRKNGVDIVFVPAVSEMYRGENLTWVNVERLTEVLCGRKRSGHFRGVITVCAKLFNIVLPDIAVFGQKDAQQAIVIKRMVADLNMPLEIIVCPTVREANGLAVSSRNKYLNERQKKDAACLYKAIQKCRQDFDSGIKDSQTLIEQMKKIIQQVSSAEIDYIEIVDAQNLQPLKTVDRRALVALAVKIGPARLIDNILLDTPEK